MRYSAELATVLFSYTVSCLKFYADDPLLYWLDDEVSWWHPRVHSESMGHAFP